MTHREIKAMLILADVTMVKIAENVGVSQSAVSQVVKGQRKSQRIRSAIAFAIGKSVSEVWPEKAEGKKK